MMSYLKLISRHISNRCSDIELFYNSFTLIKFQKAIPLVIRRP